MHRCGGVGVVGREAIGGLVRSGVGAEDGARSERGSEEREEVAEGGFRHFEGELGAGVVRGGLEGGRRKRVERARLVLPFWVEGVYDE